MFRRKLSWSFARPRPSLLTLTLSAALVASACQRAIGADEVAKQAEASKSSAPAENSGADPAPKTAESAAPKQSASGASKPRFPEPLGLQKTGPREYGAPFQGAPKRDLRAVLGQPEQHVGAALTVTGKVMRVCQRKGCWMELSVPGQDAAACRVKFKDYSFFVPKDAEGANATLEGELVVQRVSPSRVAHLEAEGAVFTNKNPDGSAIESQFIATSVRLER